MMRGMAGRFSLRPLLFVLLILAAPRLAEAEPRVALIIGNSAYGAEIGNLANPANDAKLMAKTLRGIGFDVVEVENADQNAMKRAIVDFGNKLGDAGSEATGLFYYAGHGLQVQGENFLIPVKAQIDRESDVDVEAVSADLVLKQMDFAGSAVNIVILDACRNNPLTHGFRSQVRGLAEITRKPRGSFIAYSTAPGEVAADGQGGNSPYAEALSQTIAEPGQGIEEIFREVRAKVLAATNNQQTPWDSSSLTAPFFFQAPVAQAPAPAAPAQVDSVDPKRIELAFWESIKDSKSPDDFQAYLAKYPQGDFAALAANRLKSLGAVASAAPVQPDATIRNMAPGKDDETAKAYEESFWESVDGSGSAEDLQAYLSKYPRGAHAGQAEQKLKDLGKAPPPEQPAPAAVPPPLPPFQTVDQQLYTRDRARLRAAPDKNAEVVDRADANAALKATGRSADGAWWRVALEGGRTAYVAGSVVTDQAPAPPVAAPAAPVPAPSVAAAATPPGAAPTSSATEAAPSVEDAATCKADSKASPADQLAACQRLLNGELDNGTKADTLNLLGGAQFNLGQKDAALKSFQAVTEIDPKYASAYFNIGLVRLDQYRFVEARSAFDTALRYDPDNADTIYQRGVALGDLGDVDSALSDVKRAIAANAEVSDYYIELGTLELAAGDLDAAVKAIDKAMALGAENWSGTAVFGYYIAGERDKAMEQVEKGTQEQPTYPYWPIWRALLQKSGGDESAAARSLEQGVKMVGSAWPAPIMQFLAGKISESQLRNLANTGDQKTRAERLCEVEFYRGELAYLSGDKATAKAAMRAAANVRIFYYLEDSGARARLAQLSQ